MQPLKIHIGVGGRFHADRLASSLIGAGHQVTLLTSYLKSRFKGLPSDTVRSHISSEILYRGLKSISLERLGEQIKMVSFGRWLKSQTLLDSPKISFIWSSFAKESFATSHGIRVLSRDSSHIMHQSTVLRDESKKYGFNYKPDPLCIKRELEEYERADYIAVLSNYAKDTFVSQGISPKKLLVCPLGVDPSTFSPEENFNIELPLRVLYFGTLSLRKGVQYLLDATKSMKDVNLTLVGPVEPSFRKILNKYSHYEYIKPQSHTGLNAIARKAHVYLFPTLEDGFGSTLIQAMSSGLVPITTTQCGASEWIENGKSGLFIETASAKSIQFTLDNIIANPSQLVPMRYQALALVRKLSWDNYSKFWTEWVSNQTNSHSAEEADYLLKRRGVLRL